MERSVYIVKAYFKQEMRVYLGKVVMYSDQTFNVKPVLSNAFTYRDQTWHICLAACPDVNKLSVKFIRNVRGLQKTVSEAISTINLEYLLSFWAWSSLSGGARKCLAPQSLLAFFFIGKNLIGKLTQT